MSKINLLWFGDSPAVTTGFGRVSQSILERLVSTNDYNISILGINHPVGDPHIYEGVFKIYPAKTSGNLYGINRVKEVIEKENPDIILINNDLWIVQDYVKEIPAGNRIVAYSPVDALPVSKHWLNTINQTNTRLTLYTEFGLNGVRDTIPNFPAEVISHGVDTDLFYPIDDAREFLDAIPKDAFLIMNVNRNQPRKRLDLFFQACRDFINSKQDRENIFVYYHGVLRDVGWNIPDLVERYKIDDRVIVTDQTNFTPAVGMPIEYLTKLYSAADVHVQTSLGEGFGLSPMESAACGTAQIVPDNSASKELWEGVGELINVERYELLSGGINTEGGVISVEHLVSLLDKFYYDRTLLKECATRCYNLSQDKKFSWDVITSQFDTLIKDTLSSDKYISTKYTSTYYSENKA